MKKKLSKNPRGLCPKSSEECNIEGIHLNVIKLNQKQMQKSYNQCQSRWGKA